MRHELEQYLHDRVPSAFRNGTIQNDGMVFGFQHGDGWFPLVRALLEHVYWKIENPPYRYEDRTRIESLPCVEETREAWLEHGESRVLRHVTDIPWVKETDRSDVEGTDGFTYYEHLCERPWTHFQLDQVKEKMGGLRFYYSGGSDGFNQMVRLAEDLSYRICEVCGTTQEASNEYENGWARTRCPECRQARIDGREVPAPAFCLNDEEKT